MKVEEFDILITRKKIRSIRLKVNSDGKILLSIPYFLKSGDAKDFVISKLDWLRKTHNRVQLQKTTEPEDYSRVVYLGISRSTKIINNTTRNQVFIDESGVVNILIKAGKDFSYIPNVLTKWYAEELEKIITPLACKWQEKLQVEVSGFTFRKMKTRWGTCNTRTHRITLNTELAKKPHICIEHILVHEMVHLLQRGHGNEFKKLMDKFFPQWRKVNMNIPPENIQNE